MTSVRLLALLLLSGLMPAPAAAQRETVLKQIAEPHNYYFREMYLPQVTTGPAWVTWSPDGQSVIVAMAGELWRLPLGADSLGTAVQLTTGPGYAHQPEWSPDGERVVYAVYLNDQIELRILELATLTSRTVLRNGAVNTEPRWSPDGRQVTFVSTLFAGRFHVFVAPVMGDSLGTAVRITEDHHSGLPRYYYSKYDHYISPTWSPDGKELILVSNRGKIWGGGGFWRMAATPGAPMQPVHDEETTWRARPDWSLDGKRLLYSSYLGRQRNQLWLTTADGGDPLQLTYGEFDLVNARWSPDSRRVAAISNEGGNTSLVIVTVPGGERATVAIRKRIYRAPMGRLTIRVEDAATGKPTPARISVTLADGRTAAPDDAWLQADDAFDRRDRRFEVGYFHTAGMSTLTVPAGVARIDVTHGMEYRAARAEVKVPGGGTASHTIRLSRMMSLADSGWTSGDLHVHMNYGGHYLATPQTLVAQARAEGLNLVENLIVNKEDRMPDIGYFTGRPDPISTGDFLLLHDQEYHTSWWGHTGLLGLSRHLVLPGYAGYLGTPVASLFPDNAAVADQAHAQGGLMGYVHPFDSYPDPSDTTTPLNNELPVDVALGKVDYFEVVGFSDHLVTSRVWYQLLNCGFRLPAGAGTDAMTNFASLRGPVGTNRVYVQSGLPLDRARWYGALKAGKTFATNGPLLRFTLQGQGPGGQVPAGIGRLTARITLRSLVPLDHLELIGTGKVVATIPLTGDRMSADTTFTVPGGSNRWFVLRAWAEQAVEPVLDIYPFATTSPVYIGAPAAAPSCGADADYFLRWLDRLEQGARAHPGWHTSAEKREVLERIRQAREEFERRRAP
ncbi:MAG: CehA/McbA family metallohydrolase [Gemmatimonadota bacterium]|nr:CehA/McbA family metallohydrolase [Gemmatimonadota bacterium]